MPKRKLSRRFAWLTLGLSEYYETARRLVGRRIVFRDIHWLSRASRLSSKPLYRQQYSLLGPVKINTDEWYLSRYWRLPVARNLVCMTDATLFASLYNYLPFFRFTLQIEHSSLLALWLVSQKLCTHRVFLSCHIRRQLISPYNIRFAPDISM